MKRGLVLVAMAGLSLSGAGAGETATELLFCLHDEPKTLDPLLVDDSNSETIHERITKTLDYDSCLLGLANQDLDPSAQMNVWLSSAANHRWNPSQKRPATVWEAEIDKLIRAQAAETRDQVRKRYFDRVQQIVWEQAPFLYLVTKDSLTAISPDIQNSAPVALTPQAVWNVEFLRKPVRTGESR